MEKERQRPPSSPPPVVHYTDHEASNICEKIKQDDTFMKAVQVSNHCLSKHTHTVPKLLRKLIHVSLRRKQVSACERDSVI